MRLSEPLSRSHESARGLVCKWCSVTLNRLLEIGATSSLRFTSRQRPLIPWRDAKLCQPFLHALSPITSSYLKPDYHSTPHPFALVERAVRTLNQECCTKVLDKDKVSTLTLGIYRGFLYCRSPKGSVDTRWTSNRFYPATPFAERSVFPFSILVMRSLVSRQPLMIHLKYVTYWQVSIDTTLRQSLRSYIYGLEIYGWQNQEITILSDDPNNEFELPTRENIVRITVIPPSHHPFIRL